jgi:hypothetical protein
MQQVLIFPLPLSQALTFPLPSLQEGKKALQGAPIYGVQSSGSILPVEELTDEIIDQMRQYPSDAEDRDFGLEIPE